MQRDDAGGDPKVAAGRARARSVGEENEENGTVLQRRWVYFVEMIGCADWLGETRRRPLVFAVEFRQLRFPSVQKTFKIH